MTDIESMVIHEMVADHQSVLSIWGNIEKRKKLHPTKKEDSPVSRIHIEKTI